MSKEKNEISPLRKKRMRDVPNMELKVVGFYKDYVSLDKDGKPHQGRTEENIKKNLELYVNTDYKQGEEPDTRKAFHINFEESGIRPAGWHVCPYLYPMTEDGLLKLIVDELKGTICYDATTGKFVPFVEKFGFSNELIGEVILMDLFDKLKEKLIYACGLIQNENKKDIFYEEFICRLSKHHSRKALIDALKYNLNIAVKSNFFDNRIGVLAAKNKLLILNRETGSYTVRDIQFEDYVNTHLGCDFDESADCPIFKNMLLGIFEGDTEKIQFLQMFLGMTLFGVNEQKAFGIFTGPGTNNGKSTLISALKKVLGEYAGTGSKSIILRKKDMGARATPEVVALRNLRMVFFSETQEGAYLDEAMLKELTGNTDITGRPLYGEVVTFRPQFIMIMECNALPQIRDTSIFRRGTIIPFEFKHSFTEAEADTSLASKLEKELSGILNWMLEGWKLYCTTVPMGTRWKLPDCITNAIAAYKTDSDKVGEFLSKNYTITGDCHDKMLAIEIYQEYQTWCEENGETKLGRNTFYNRLSTVMGKVQNEVWFKSHGSRYLKGIREKTQEEKDDGRFEQFLGKTFRLAGANHQLPFQCLWSSYLAWSSKEGIVPTSVDDAQLRMEKNGYRFIGEDIIGICQIEPEKEELPFAQQEIQVDP